MQLIRPADLDRSVNGAFSRGIAASVEKTGSNRLWAAYAEMDPGAVSGAHHHGIAETIIFVLQGSARFCAGPALEDWLDAGGGDFVWVPPGEVHVEMNLSADAPVRMIVVRSPYDISIDAEAPRGWQPPSAPPDTGP